MSWSDLNAFVTSQLDDPRAAFSVGTFGALAEFVREPSDDIELTHRGSEHTAVSAQGALTVTVSDDLTVRAWQRPTGDSWSHSVALCLPEDRAEGPTRTVLTELGPDSAAARECDRGSVLVDLGLGVAHLEACVRTDDPGLLRLLRAAEGRAFADCPELAGALVAAGPHRVFRTARTRAEVYTPIPPPTGTSPAGPHTHLLPRLLAHGRTHAATDPIAPGTVAVLSVNPAHPTHDALGRPVPFDEQVAAAFERVLERWGDPDAHRAGVHVVESVRAGRPAQAPPAEMSSAGGQAWEVALRRLAAGGETGGTWQAWRSASPRVHEDVPYHQAHA
ncbi:DUF6925 family protein [Pseudonocardia spinosispora]|uniref:DUF6925 family protein n=1 Tax=Pseudonocardia spinosispora TaxID=103441 RepID=UPI00041169FB|nr:hypothetical protein [Pseudonocardia spinosispora]